MKKAFVVTLTLALISTIFVGCNSSGKALKDGSYKAQAKAADSHGWIEYVEIKVENEKITEVIVDAVNDGVQEAEKKDMKKSEDSDYKDAMLNSGYDTWPSDFYTKLADRLIEKQKISDVDDVAGATTSSTNFKKMVKALEKNMANGDTSVVTVDLA